MGFEQERRRLNLPDRNRAARVFTPASPARLTFVERAELNTQLVSALQTPGKQVVIYGETGSGKTTLISNKLFQLYPDQITTRCTALDTIDSLLLDAFDQLDAFYVAGETRRASSQVNARLAIDYKAIKAHVSSHRALDTHVESRRLTQPRLTPGRLAQLIGAAGCCWVLDDFHKVTTETKQRLSNVMKVFVDSADEFPDLKIVAVGATNSARSVVKLDAEMQNRVAEVHVPLMSNLEIAEIVSTGALLLDLDIPTEITEKIVSYSSGLAAVCHQLCLNICLSQGIYDNIHRMGEIFTVLSAHLEEAIKRHVADSSDTLTSTFDRALRKPKTWRHDHSWIILSALARLGLEGGTKSEIAELLRECAQEYPLQYLRRHLEALQSSARGAIIKRDKSSGRFSFAKPVFRAHARMLFGDGAVAEVAR